MDRDDIGFIVAEGIIISGVILGLTFSNYVASYLVSVPMTVIGLVVQQLFHWSGKKKKG